MLPFSHLFEMLDDFCFYRYNKVKGRNGGLHHNG
jgi:hypothetical protein